MIRRLKSLLGPSWRTSLAGAVLIAAGALGLLALLLGRPVHESITWPECVAAIATGAGLIAAQDQPTTPTT